jgi:hypothetical protein
MMPLFEQIFAARRPAPGLDGVKAKSIGASSPKSKAERQDYEWHLRNFMISASAWSISCRPALRRR